MRNLTAYEWKVFLIGLAACCVLALYVLYRLKRGAEDDDGRVDPKGLIHDFERAFAEGEIDGDEYRRVMESLIRRKAALIPEKPGNLAKPVEGEVPAKATKPPMAHGWDGE